MKTFLHISACYVWKIASSFSDPWFLFCWQSPETLNHHVEAKMLDLVHNLTLYWLGLMTLFAYLSWYVSLKLSAASLTRTIYEAIFHKNNMKNLHGHGYEDSSEITSIVLRDFESLVTDPDWISESFGRSSQKTGKNIREQNEMSCLAQWLGLSDSPFPFWQTETFNVSPWSFTVDTYILWNIFLFLTFSPHNSSSIVLL